ncbi:methyl-accepting chemotaxis protein [Burkholderia cenocepacia]|uniref:methyl-accepting chemotaxis protein n=1 Tax=Burkholderia cepacia complex TaxID=87882 RepID=UPI003908A80A
MLPSRRRVPASEHGCGFAVVAGEVRSLAQRGAGAAKDIKVLVRHSVESISGGAEHANRPAHAMGDLRCAIRRNQRQHLRSFGMAAQRDRASQRVGESHGSGDPQQCWRG